MKKVAKSFEQAVRDFKVASENFYNKQRKTFVVKAPSFLWRGWQEIECKGKEKHAS